LGKAQAKFKVGSGEQNVIVQSGRGDSRAKSKVVNARGAGGGALVIGVVMGSLT
jgi:hypothetical protein